MTKRERQFKAYYEKTGIQITEEPLYDEHYLKVEEDVDDLHYGIRENTVAYLVRLERLVKKYPKVALFKNYLHLAYSNSNQTAKADKLLKETVEQHPGYIFALNTLIMNIHDEREMRTMEHHLGPNKSILDLYKREDKLVHKSEFLAYYSILAYFWARLNEPHKSADALLPLIDAGFTKAELNDITRRIMGVRMEYMKKRMDDSQDKTFRVEDKSAFPTNVSTEMPAFNHPEIKVFYEYDLKDISESEYESIAVLPRKTLIEDLEMVLQDAIYRFDVLANMEFFDFKRDSIIHALYFLGALESEDSLQKVLNLLRMDSEFLEWWVESETDFYFYPTLYALAKNQLSALADFVKEENRNANALSQASLVVSQVAQHQPHRRAEVITWYKDVFDYYLENEENKNLLDRRFLSICCMHLETMRAVELIEYVNTFDRKGWIDEFYVGTATQIIEKMEMEYHASELMPLPLDLGEYYNGEYQNRRIKREINEDALELMNRIESHPGETLISEHMLSALVGSSTDPLGRDNSPFSSDSEYEYTETQTVKRIAPKVGRNDPCPCGSGKKYKKCCLRK